MLKRGLSTIITAIILIVLVLVAVGIMWAVINNIISNQSEGISLGKLTLDADIKGVGINETTNSISILVKRKPGQGHLAGFKFVFSNGTDTEVWEEDKVLEELEEWKFTFTLSMNVSEVITITLIPLIKSGDEKVLGNVVEVYDVKTGRSIEPPVGPVCGNEICEEGENEINCPEDCDDSVIFLNLLHNLSENIYDGNGHWGENEFGYKMLLRDSYWRGDVYGRLSQTNHPKADLFEQRSNEVAAYLKQAQEEAGTGVFGIPADPNNPEFGVTIQQVIDTCPTCINNGWIIDLPDGNVPELYYDHGYSLVSISRTYIRKIGRASCRERV